MEATTKSPARLWGGWVLLLFVTSAQISFAQSLGDLARRERARKQDSSQQAVRVYTNKDLERRKILDPEGRVPLETPNPISSLSDIDIKESEKISGAPRWPDTVPLGDVARYYRRAKQHSQEQLSAEEAFAAPSQDVPSPTKPESTAPSKPFQGPLENPPMRMVQLGPQEDLPKDHRIRVQKGDTLWKLASRHLGRGSEWQKIAAANPELTNPHQLRANQWLRLPLPAALKTANQVRVQSGDSLWKLARSHWGNGEAWDCIAAANPQIQDNNRIFPGQLLTIPASCTPRI